MHCPQCGHNLRERPTGDCPACGTHYSTGAELIPMARRLLHPDGRCRCVVCKTDLTDVTADRCPDCSARYRAAV